MEVTINRERQLYVMKCQAGYSCLGFESAMLDTQALAQRLGKPELAPKKQEFGKRSVLDKRNQLLELLTLNKTDLGTWFNPKTPQQVCKVLEALRKRGEKIHVFYGDAKTGRDWNQEQDVVGHIGRSIGPMKVPLLLDDEDGVGGMAMLDHCLVRIIRVSDGKELYRHPNYHTRHFEAVVNDDRKYTMKVLADGSDYAFFKTEGAAYHWLAFILGACHTKPQ